MMPFQPKQREPITFEESPYGIYIVHWCKSGRLGAEWIRKEHAYHTYCVSAMRVNCAESKKLVLLLG